MNLEPGLAHGKPRHKRDEITQPQAHSGPRPESSPTLLQNGLIGVDKPNFHSCVCDELQGSPALLSASIEGRSSLAAKFLRFFFFSSLGPIQQLISLLRLSAEASTVLLVSVMWNHARRDLDQDHAAHLTQATEQPTLGKPRRPYQPCLHDLWLRAIFLQASEQPRYKSCSSFTGLCHDNTITWLPVPHALRVFVRDVSGEK